MSIKFKKREQECDYITTRGVATSNGGYLTEFIKVCWWNEVPIRNWGFSPTSIYKRWSENTPVPSSELVTVVFPEYDKAIDYENMTNFRYIIRKGAPMGYTSPDVIELISDKDLKNIPATDDGAVSFRVSYKNFNLLKEGRNEIEIDCTVVATNKNGIEEDLGKRSFSIIIEKVKQGEITDPYITTDKNEYYLTYIKSTEELLGDTSVKVSCHNFPEIRRLYADIILTYQNNDTIIAAAFTGFAEQTVPSVIIMNVTKGSDIKDIPIGKHTLSKFMSQMHTYTRYPNQKHYKFPIEATFYLEVKENAFEGFEIDKNRFDFKLLLHENKTASGSFSIQNPKNLSFIFEKSDWITIEQRGNTVSFTTLSAKELKAGKKQGFIKIQSGQYHRYVNIVVVVEKTIDNSLDDINFCLDKKYILVRKENPKAEFLRAHFSMVFLGYDKKEQTIEQTYEYVFFNNEVTLYTGEEVQDFFAEIEALEQLQINETAIVSPSNLFKSCKTDITLTEIDQKGNSYKTEKLNTIWFLPGKKPKAYPYLTNGTIRRTYTNSLICVSALQEEFLSRKLGEIAGNSVDTTQINLSKMVVNMSFRRFVADKTFGELNIIKKGLLELHPITNAPQVIDVLFQNQNFCPDWFSFSGELEQHEDITHTLSQHIRNGKDFKAHVERKTTLKLNTGWLLEEEVELLTELIVSPLCFANIKGKWQRLIPISKKSLVYDTSQNIRSFIVEFQLSNQD